MELTLGVTARKKNEEMTMPMVFQKLKIGAGICKQNPIVFETKHLSMP